MKGLCFQVKDTRLNKAVYWFFTVWLAFGMGFGGVIQIMKVDIEIDMLVNKLGYPEYFLPLLGAWKVLGVLAILTPKMPVLKEWAYAGFFFSMSGAFYSHLMVGDSFAEIFPSMLMMAIIAMSWSLRPASRKVACKA